jgi:hypothetical protein
MIELRWVVVGKNRHLQYRYHLFPLVEEKVWTDWIDVPEIDHNEAAWEDVRAAGGIANAP